MSIVTAMEDHATAKLIDSLKDLEDDGSNFSTWKYLQLEVFEYRGLDGYVNGTVKKPDDSDTAELEKWKKNMRTARLQITMHVGPDVLQHIMDKSSPSKRVGALSIVRVSRLSHIHPLTGYGPILALV